MLTFSPPHKPAQAGLGPPPHIHPYSPSGPGCLTRSFLFRGSSRLFQQLSGPLGPAPTTTLSFRHILTCVSVLPGHLRISPRHKPHKGKDHHVPGMFKALKRSQCVWP